MNIGEKVNGVKRQKISRKERMQTFDELPLEVRRALSNASYQISTTDIKQDLRRRGMRLCLATILESSALYRSKAYAARGFTHHPETGEPL